MKNFIVALAVTAFIGIFTANADAQECCRATPVRTTVAKTVNFMKTRPVARMVKKVQPVRRTLKAGRCVLQRTRKFVFCR